MMAFARRAVFRTVNRALAPLGLELTRLEMDFDSRPSDAATLDILFSQLANSYEEWISCQTLFSPEPFPTRFAVESFYEKWLRSPFRRQNGGSRFNNLLWLHLITHSYKPAIVIDSGTFEGASAWAFATALTTGTVHSYDIDMSQLKLKMREVRYVEADWIMDDLELRDARVMCYFDDHVDQCLRLTEATRKGGSLLIFDDDFPLSSYFHMAPSASVLPKIEFLLEPRLRDSQELTWIHRGKPQSYRIDKARLDDARKCIAQTTRLPFTGLITGIHQTPYRLVVTKKPV